MISVRAISRWRELFARTIRANVRVVVLAWVFTLTPFLAEPPPHSTPSFPLLILTLSVAPFSPLPSYPSPVYGVSSLTYFNIQVAAHLDAGPTGPSGKCQAAQSAPVRHCCCCYLWQAWQYCWHSVYTRYQCTHDCRISRLRYRT